MEKQLREWAKPKFGSLKRSTNDKPLGNWQIKKKRQCRWLK